MQERNPSTVPGPRVTRRSVLSTTGALVAGGLAGCVGGGESGAGNGDTGDGESDGSGGDAPAWRTTELTRVRGDGAFTIDGLEPPVIVQCFAVWCPTCERQSNNMLRLPDDITQVSLNVDPNEDAAKVRDHANEHGFKWRFAVAPSAMTDSLIEQFGTTVTNAPSTPIIVACGDGTATFDAGRVRSASELESMADGC